MISWASRPWPRNYTRACAPLNASSPLQRELIHLATTDPLIGLCNRRGFFERAHEACARVVPDGRLSAIILDIDNF